MFVEPAGSIIERMFTRTTRNMQPCSPSIPLSAAGEPAEGATTPGRGVGRDSPVGMGAGLEPLAIRSAPRQDRTTEAGR
jgi:hypothetical protein